MAKKQARPGRTLVVFLLGSTILYGLIALAGSWKPALGLDLQGGTRITLISQGDPSNDNLEEARTIIDRRVNGSGVSEAEVITQSNNIVVEIPGRTRRDLVDTVERQAQLRFRLVACSDQCSAPTAPTPTPPTEPTGPASPSASSPAPPAPEPTEEPTEEPTTANRVAPGFARGGTGGPSGEPTDAETEPTTPGDPSSDPGNDPTEPTTPDPTEGATPTAPADTEAFDENAVVPLDEGLAFKDGAYTQADVDLFDSYTCNADGTIEKSPDAAADVPDAPIDNPVEPLVSCSAAIDAPGDDEDSPQRKYLLSPAVIQGTDLNDAGYGIPQGQVGYAVQLDIGGKGENVFAEASQQMQTPQGATPTEFFAIVLDGVVLSAPYFSSVISDGNAEISGNFTETEARGLSTSLKYGSLPISFDPSTENIGPSLAGDQLQAGLIAGAFGLGLVLIYCLLYYRGLGLVVVASLLAAAGVTYALVLLLSETAGFVLTLPGIAGLIIAVGVTADSFIIFFERIRDEMRDGKSMRVAVETGWKRAKVTRLAAQVVSLLSAAVLYIFATGAVKGFGFALGLTTIVDLAILFWFTKPMVSWLAKFRFFNSGNRLSGLSAETLGIDGLAADPGPRTKTAATAGGRA